MLDHVNVENVLYIDIETVPGVPSFDYWGDRMKKLWDKKSKYFRAEEEVAEDVFQRAGIYAEFGKVICISVGLIYYKEGGRVYRVKSFYGDDEKQLLQEFAQMLNGFEGRGEKPFLCGHNAKEFDFPFIARRMLINGVKLPTALNVAGKKPWEVPFLDTMELWKFGDFKNYTSLDLLTAIFDIPTPKDDIDGSQVAEVYYKENDLDRIVTYCEKDTLAVAQLMLRYKGENLIDPENFESV